MVDDTFGILEVVRCIANQWKDIQTLVLFLFFLGIYTWVTMGRINNMAIVLLFSACAGSNECTTDGHPWEPAYRTMHNGTQPHLHNVTSQLLA